MKKMSLLFVTLLMLVSGIIFSGCGNGYKKLKISLGEIYYSSNSYYAEDGVISLVLDDSSLSRCGVTFNLSGAKEWGTISVTASPAEVIKVDQYSFDGLTCNVTLSALQPVEKGEVIFTHLGSGKNCKVPLKIGMKLKKVNVSGDAYVLERPIFEQDKETRIFEIPTDELLSCEPVNYTDVIVWKQKDRTVPVPGVKIISYDKDGNEIKNADAIKNAVKSVVSIDKNCITDATITIVPVSILDGNVTEYDKEAKLYITELLNKKDIATLSDTHGDDNKILTKLALISNPDKSNPRRGYDGYDLYSTAEIDLKIAKVNANNNSFSYLDFDKTKYWDEIYDMTVSSENIEGLTLEYLDFGKVRAIATSTSFGSGNIKIKFAPKNCVGHINQFEISVPCTVGERATSFAVTNNGTPVKINEQGGVLSAITPLNDSNSLGQAFNFEVLSTNTLSALSQYRIEIHKELIYISPDIIAKGTNEYFIDESNNLYDLSKLTGNPYQISISKDGNNVKFYEMGNYFVSEPLSKHNTIYIKWISTGIKQPPVGLGIKISNVYDGSYDNIKDNGFSSTQIGLNIEFDRQRTVGAMTYDPASVVYNYHNNIGERWVVANGEPGDENWQFYLDDSKIVDVSGITGDESTTFYGFHIDKVFGLNNSENLTPDELMNININVTSNCDGLGFAVLDTAGINKNILFKKVATFNYNKDRSNVVIIGKISYEEVDSQNVNEQNFGTFYVLTDSGFEQATVYDIGMTYYKSVDYKINYGDYTIEFRQAGSNVKAEPLIKTNLTIYKTLSEDEVSVTIPTPDFMGDVLTTADMEKAYVLATSKQYGVKVDITNKHILGEYVLSVEVEDSGAMGEDYTKNMPGKDEDGNLFLKTGETGSYKNNAENFITFKYTISIELYSYYKKTTDKAVIEKFITVYVYEPITSVLLSDTHIDKYDYETLNGNVTNSLIGGNSDYQKEYGSHTLTLTINNGNASILDYVKIDWSVIGEGIEYVDDPNLPDNQHTYSFNAPKSPFRDPLHYNEDGTRAKYTGIIVATINQYGISIPVYCSVNVYQPIISTGVELITQVNLFKSGNPYVNLKVGESKKFEAVAKSSVGPVTFDTVDYAIYDQSSGTSGIATITDGTLTAKSAGKVKLIIVPMDKVEPNWKTSQTDYIEYLEQKKIPYISLDVIISDGTEENPYLIGSRSDFDSIADDFKDDDQLGKKVNYKHYALVSNINLNGLNKKFGGLFNGSLTSYRQYENDTARYKIFGIILDKARPVIFTELGDDGVIKNVDFVMDFNYTETENISDTQPQLMGIVGTNNGKLENVTVTSSGRVDVKTYSNKYTIGSLAAVNNGDIKITETKLVAVEASVKVIGNTSATIILGGMVGENGGTIIGCAPTTTATGDGQDIYSNVYYGKEGITAYVTLQVTESSDNGALGGAVGYNNGGKIEKVLTDGEVLGIAESQELTVNNVGGIIGKNEQTEHKVAATITIGGVSVLGLVSAELGTAEFQIADSYSTAKVKGWDNVGGAVGYDTNGEYSHVYYEKYTSGNGVEGNNNVGGLIGYANDTYLRYCYANNFAMGSVSDSAEYDIVGKENVAGLIGFVNSTGGIPTSTNYTSIVTTIISSAASVNIYGESSVAGLVGALESRDYLAIYTAYYCGSINDSNAHAIINYSTGNTPYNNVYWIANGIENVDKYLGPKVENGRYPEESENGFKVEKGVNNGKPYIVDSLGKNIISEIPTLITITDSITHYYKQDNNGEYYLDSDGYQPYTKDVVVSNENRYTLVASVVDTDGINDISTPSDYRAKALVLYYYGIKNMADDKALDATYAFNTVNMHTIVKDEMIKVSPEAVALKRFTLRSSDPSVIRVLDDGNLLLLNEGQVTITMVSIINPSVTASFVAIVSSKVKEFSLYTSATLHDNFNVVNQPNQTLSIVKHSSKILYPDVESTIKYFEKDYEYKAAAHMGTKLTVEWESDNNESIDKFVSLNGTRIRYDENGDVIPDSDTETIVYKMEYLVPFSTPITISVKEYSEKLFKFVAVPYFDLKYQNADGSISALDSNKIMPNDAKPYSVTFNVSSKMGVSAINTNKHALTMMPSDAETNLNVKVSTDTHQSEIYIDVESVGDDTIKNPLNLSESINVFNMLNIKLNGVKQEGTQNVNNSSILNYSLDVSQTTFNNELRLQEFNLKLRLNEKSHYITEKLRLQITIYAKIDGKIVTQDGQEVKSVIFIDIEPQTISSIIARNYRKVTGDIKHSTIIRPGSTNIISVDISPNIAAYDSVRIVDSASTERILFRQVYKDANGNYKSPSNMDIWQENQGLQEVVLEKLDENGQKSVKVSQVFAEAALPIASKENLTHNLIICVYRGDEIIYISELILEAVAYPTVIMTYTDPKGNDIAIADTSKATDITPDEDTGKTVVKATAQADLAVGVEAGVTVETHNIDAGSLKPSIKIKDLDGTTDYTNEVIGDSTNTYSKLLTVTQVSGKYILVFTNDTKRDWNNLVGKTIHLTFNATKTVNGSTEECESTIIFTVRKFVIHGISMTHENSRGNLYGDWGDDGFSTRLYFDKTDISYYHEGYWNTKYEMLTETQLEFITNVNIRNDRREINKILTELNNGWNGKKEIKLYNTKEINLLGTTLSRDFSSPNGGFTIKNQDSSFKIRANNPTSNTNYENINDYIFEVRFKINYDNNYPCLVSLDSNDASKFKWESRKFGFALDVKRTPFDKYEEIKTKEAFENMLENKYYMLGANITLTNYTPINVPIAGFSGGEYTITIKSFNESQLKADYLTGDINIGLFGTLAQDSVIQNLKVNYDDVLINLDAEYDEHPGNYVFFGGIAGKNLGVITNTNVTGSVNITANNIAAELINCGGIVSLNGDLEAEKVATITNSTSAISLKGIAIIGGIAQSNYGKIVNTNFSGNIDSTSNLPNFASAILTSGFVVNNQSNGHISLSYVKFDTAEYSIKSAGNTAGFVLNNNGTITDCYIADAKIGTQGNIGGFVYNNSGNISNSYSYVETEESLFYSKFIYVTTSSGTITNSYCIAYTNSNINERVDGLTTLAPNKISEIEWTGFIFAKTAGEGLWKMSEKGPELPNAGFNPNYEEYNIYNIYDVETYDGWLKGIAKKDIIIESNTVENIIENVTIRIVRDIDFDAESFIGNPISASQTLMANIEGNNMEIRNFTIYKLEDEIISGSNYIGLFKQIIGATITNLTITPAEIKASGTYAVGSLAGVMDSVKLYNVNIDNEELLVLGRNAVGGLAGMILGDFEIIGVNTKASVLSVYKHGVNGQYNMYLDRAATGVSGVGNINKVSYAGSVAGIIDGYGYASQLAQEWRDINEYYVAKNITIDNSVVLGGENVGGLFGFVGEFTLVKNAHYIVPTSTSYQGAYVSGGLVGENRGIIQNCSIIAESNNDQRVNLTHVFNNFAKVNGGIVGYNIGGLIDGCIVDIDVCTNVRFATVGAVIGRNVAGSVFDTTIAGGVLKGYFVGGIVGADYSYGTVHRTILGEATVTESTIDAFETVRNIDFVKYYSADVNDNPFRNNIFTEEFIKLFIAGKKYDEKLYGGKTYSYNREYNGPDSNTKLVNTSSIYGLVIGYSENLYSSGYYEVDVNGQYEYDSTTDKYVKRDTNEQKYKYVDECEYTTDNALKITLTKGRCDLIDLYEYEVNNNTITIPCIKVLENTSYTSLFNEADTTPKILYLVAYDSASGYESWSSANGYTDALVIIK